MSNTENVIQLMVRGHKGSTFLLDIHKDAQIAELFRKIADKTGQEQENIKLVQQTKEIRYDQHKDKHLAEHGIINNAALVMVLRLPGGAMILGNAVEYTDLPDMITLNDDPEIPRFKMPCGHAISSGSLIDYCRSELKSGKYKIVCPSVDPVVCGKEWAVNLVLRLTGLSKEDGQGFQFEISENYLRETSNTKECPGCKSICMRNSSTDIRIVCLVCSKSGFGRRYEFCWCCLSKWCGSGTRDCGNRHCSGRDPRLDALADAPEKEIDKVPGVPAMRACVKCGALIEHKKGCKQMTCRCGQEFCFICLKPRVDGKWQCGSFNSKCIVAPRQTQVPGDN